MPFVKLSWIGRDGDSLISTEGEVGIPAKNYCQKNYLIHKHICWMLDCRVRFRNNISFSISPIVMSYCSFWFYSRICQKFAPVNSFRPIHHEHFWFQKRPFKYIIVLLDSFFIIFSKFFAIGIWRFFKVERANEENVAIFTIVLKMVTFGTIKVHSAICQFSTQPYKNIWAKDNGYVLEVHMPQLSHFRKSGKSCAKLIFAEN